MRKIKWESKSYNIMQEFNDIRIVSNESNILLLNQNLDVANILIENLNTVRHYYMNKMNSSVYLKIEDIDTISSLIVFNHIYMYNSWRQHYKKLKNESLAFKEKDFKNVTTYDIIFLFFRRKYPDSWIEKCSVLLDMDIDEVQECYSNRKKFYEK